MDGRETLHGSSASPNAQGLAMPDCAAQASYIAADTWKRLRACTVGRAESSRIACSSTSIQRRATDT